MRILWICNDIPLPANSGGRVDVWRRLAAMAAAGHQVALVCWYDAKRASPPDAATLAELRKVCAQVHALPITRSAGELLGRLLYLGRLPSHAASRWVTAQAVKGLAVHMATFAPEAVLLDGLYGGALAMHWASRLNLPMFYRAHNIEGAYMADQARLETRWLRRAGLQVNRIGLSQFEVRVIRAARRVFDISGDDLAHWRTQGFTHVDWLPTTVDDAFVHSLAEPSSASPSVDVLYFGNLNTPNNVEAVGWLVRSVLPLLARRDVRVVLAGSAPTAAVRALAQSDARISLLENPTSMAHVVARAQVLVNPMRAGSGVNLKSVEMLFTNAALVSTTVGVKGLPAEAKACFAVADDAAGFASAIERGLSSGAAGLAARVAAREPFAPAAAVALLSAALADAVNQAAPKGHT